LRFNRLSDEPAFDLYVLGTWCLWLGLAWLGADLLVAPSQRAVNPRPVLGLFVALGLVAVISMGPHLDATDRARSWLYLLIPALASILVPVLCLVFGLRPSTKLYPRITEALLWAWVGAGSVVSIGAAIALWRSLRKVAA
jgi:hypothetical protein